MDQVDRPRRRGEDVVDWAIASGRIAKRTEKQYRQLLAAGQVTEQFIENLASIYEPAGSVSASAGADASYRPPVRAASGKTPAAEYLGNDSLYRMALQAGPEPLLFPGSGDLPAACASGMDPQALASAPWWLRPGIAEAPTLASARDMLELASGPDADIASIDQRFVRASGMQDFKGRVNDWAGKGSQAAAARAEEARYQQMQQARVAASGPRREPAEHELYDAVFGQSNARAAKAKADREAGAGLARQGYYNPVKTRRTGRP